METKLIKTGNFTSHIKSDVYWRSEEFENLENYKNTAKPPINKEQAVKNLVEFSEILDIYKVKHLLSYGTLLGAYREHDFIEHDLDTDLIYFDNNALVKALTSLEFIELNFKVGRVQNIELTSVYRGGEFIDLYLYSQLDAQFWGMHAWKNVRLHKNILFPCSIIDLFGKRFRTIGNIDEYFKINYGDDWHIPIKNKHAEVI